MLLTLGRGLDDRDIDCDLDLDRDRVLDDLDFNLDLGS